MPNSPRCDAVQDARLRLIVDSYRRLTGKSLVAAASGGTEMLRQEMWDAPRAIVAHGTEDDPVFFYANRLALELFDMSFEDFTRLPSRYSAEPMERDARTRLLEQVARRGYVDDYSGVRIAASGRRFIIEAGTVWNLADEAGVCHGQAATFTARR